MQTSLTARVPTAQTADRTTVARETPPRNTSDTTGADIWNQICLILEDYQISNSPNTAPASP